MTKAYLIKVLALADYNSGRWLQSGVGKRAMRNTKDQLRKMFLISTSDTSSPSIQDSVFKQVTGL